MGSVRRNHVRGGTDDMRTAAGISLDSRNFCRMISHPSDEHGECRQLADDRCQILDVVGNRAFIERL